MLNYSNLFGNITENNFYKKTNYGPGLFLKENAIADLRDFCKFMKKYNWVLMPAFRDFKDSDTVYFYQEISSKSMWKHKDNKEYKIYCYIDSPWRGFDFGFNQMSTQIHTLRIRVEWNFLYERKIFNLLQEVRESYPASKISTRSGLSFGGKIYVNQYDDDFEKTYSYGNFANGLTNFHLELLKNIPSDIKSAVEEIKLRIR